MASSEVELPEFVKEIWRKWNPIDIGRVGGVFALLTDDEWRHENRRDLVLNTADKEELGVSENDTVWVVAHSRVTVMFFEATSLVSVVYVNRRPIMHPGWL